MTVLPPQPATVVRSGFDRALGLASVEPGWHALIDRLFVRLAREPHARLVQIKPKFGALAVYVQGPVSNDLYAYLRALERESTRTCEICGAEGSTRKDLAYWTLCGRHAAERMRER